MSDMNDMNDFDATERELERAIARAAEKMPRRAKRDIRRRVLAHAGGANRVQRLVFLRAATALSITTALLGGVSVGAAAALPGDLLYGLKRSAENATVAILPDGALEDGFLFTLAIRRGHEADGLIARGASDAAVTGAITQFRAAVARAYAADGTAGGLPVATSGQRRLVESVEAMAASVRASYEETVGAREGRPSGSGGSGSPGTSPSIVTPTPGPGGSGSTNGPSPSDDPGSGSGVHDGSDTAPRGQNDPDSSQGSGEATRGPANGRKP